MPKADPTKRPDLFETAKKAADPIKKLDPKFWMAFARRLLSHVADRTHVELKMKEAGCPDHLIKPALDMAKSSGFTQQKSLFAPAVDAKKDPVEEAAEAEADVVAPPVKAAAPEKAPAPPPVKAPAKP